MIIKVGVRGSDPGGMIRYLADTQTQNRRNHYNLHIDPHLVTGSLGYTGPLDAETVSQVVADLRTPSVQWNEHTTRNNHIWHAAIVLKPGEGPLPDDVWKNISKDFMKEMGLDKKGPTSYTRWVAVNHGLNNGGADHVHIAANLICEDGRLISPWKDYIRSQKVAMSLEDKYSLEILPSRRVGLSARGYSQGDHGRTLEQGHTETRKTELERRVRAAAVGVLNSKQFVENLAADGIGYKPRLNASGKTTGYAVNLPETTTSKGVEHWWAGGKLARDLSLPRLQQFWKNNSTDTPKHAQAVDELRRMQQQMPQASAEVLADASHQLAGALAIVSQKTEAPPGPLALASHEAGKLAQTRTYTQRAKPPALSVAMLFLMAADPDGPVGKAVMIKQLMATYRALLNAHTARSYVANPERTVMAGAEDEVLEMGLTAGITAGAVMLERHALHRTQEQQRAVPEQWDRNTIRGFREQDKWDQMRARVDARELEPGITHEQREQIQALSEQFGAPGMQAGTELYTQKEAAGYIADLQAHQYSGPTTGEHVVLPQTHAQEMRAVDDFMGDLEAKHGHKIPAAAAETQTMSAAPVQAAEQAMAAQLKWLHTKGGLSETETRGLGKADASRIIAGDWDTFAKHQEAVTLTPVKNITTPKAPPKYSRGR